MADAGVSPSPASAVPALQRALGRWDLAAIGINQTIGGAIFLIPAQVAAAVGAWSPVWFLLGAGLTMLVALSLAEVGSRFDATGGPYLYARAAFGRFVAFEVGWMQWFTRVTSFATVANGLALSVGYYWGGATAGWGRAALIAGATVILTAVNLRGIRQSARVVNALTLGKLVPLFVFIAVGLFFVRGERFGPLPPVSLDQATTAALLVVYLFGGYEVLAVPAGEAREPRRHVPFAMVTTVVVVGVVTLLGQIVAVGTLDNLAASSTPLADAAAGFMGRGGALLISLGAIISMSGNLFGQILTSPRMIYALAEQGDLPPFFRRIHPVYRTPSTAIVFSAAVSLALALSGTFAGLAVAAAVARLIPYAASCGALVVLRRREGHGLAGRATFTVPGGPLVPLLAVTLTLGLVVMASTPQLVGGVAALAVGAALFAVARSYAQPVGAARPAKSPRGSGETSAASPGAK